MRNARANKFHAKPTVRDGIRFDSRAEADWWAMLALSLRAGEIRSVNRQVTYTLGDISYRADFEIVTDDGERIAQDVKGVETPRFRLVRRLWAKYGPCPLQVIKRRGRKWFIEVIAGSNEPRGWPAAAGPGIPSGSHGANGE